MALDPHTPVIVGTGQVVQRAEGLDDALEPLALMERAVRQATADAGLDAVPAPDSIRVVSLFSWPYRDPGRLLAAALGVETAETALTASGGNAAQSLVNTTASEIQAGRLDLAVLTGAECWRTRVRATKEGAHLDWKKLPKGTEPTRLIGRDEPMNHPAETSAGADRPVHVYPIFETALRAAGGEDVDDHRKRIAELWSHFSDVAATNPYAWVRQPLSAAEIATPGPANRMIGLPYPKYMNSNNDVDQAAALIVCSVERARALGISDDRFVFPHAGSDCHDHYLVSHRADLRSSPAVAVGGRAALDLAGLTIDDVDLLDLYSCFPSAVQIGAAALGLPLDWSRPLTRTGGLTFAGGPWNNYPMHAIATVARELRDGLGRRGFVWANGGYTTKHSFGVYAMEPAASGGFRHVSPQAEIDVLPRRELAEGEDAAGPARIEGYTVVHDRGGEPEAVVAACLRPDGRRAWGRSTDPDLTRAMCEGEWVDRPVTLTPDATLYPHN